jgi:hypothetical protein
MILLITNGTAFSSENEVIIGEMAAGRLNKTLGDTLTSPFRHSPLWETMKW